MKAKYVLVVLAFAACLALVVLVRQALSGDFKIHYVDFYDNGEDWSGFKFNNISLSDDRKFLKVNSPDKPGIFESPAQETEFDFNEILVSWNCHIEDSSAILFIIAVSPDNETWYNFNYQKWGKLPSIFDEYENQMPPRKIKNVGWVDEDCIKIDKPMKFYKIVGLCFADDKNLLSFDRMTACYSNTEVNMRLYHLNLPLMSEIESVELAVPYKSQQWLPDSISGRTCSPTSVTMILNYHGRDFHHQEVAAIVYDELNDIYGNWPYNTQAAYTLGLKKTWIGRHNSFNELVDELKAGNPVAISIAFGEDQKLTGAPYQSTDGHLIVVRGFNSDGNVLVNDPAGDDVDEGVAAYDIDELTAVWTGHQGVAYHLWPE